MEILLPENIFSRMLVSSFDKQDSSRIHFSPSGLLSKKIIEMKNSVGLIPTMDLIYHKDLFVSSKHGITFDESLSNAYIYFNQAENQIKEIVLAGDVSVNEGVLTKILYSETYGVDVELSFEKTNGSSVNKSRVLVGDRNFLEGDLESAISFTEEIIEIISAPYVNFVFASQTKELLNEFDSKYRGIISAINSTEVFESFRDKFPEQSRNYLTENLQHVMFNLDEQDLEGIKQLLQLPYFHGIIKDMIDVRFV